MEKRIYDKKTGIQYELQGDYYLPCLTLPEQPKVEIGIWGKRHLRYIKQHHKIRYTNLLTSCKLTAYLADIDEQAEEMFFRLVKQLAEKEGVTEQLKADNQMLWVAKMNNIRNRATEIVNTEFRYIGLITPRILSRTTSFHLRFRICLLIFRKMQRSMKNVRYLSKS